MLTTELRQEELEKEYWLGKLKDVCNKYRINIIPINISPSESIIYLKDNKIILLSENATFSAIHNFIYSEFGLVNSYIRDEFLLTDLLTV